MLLWRDNVAPIFDELPELILQWLFISVELFERDALLMGGILS
jgi:hypothetical protein